MNAIEKRQAAEKKIVRRFVKDALAAGYRLAVSLERGYDVEDMLLGSTSEKEIMEEAFAGDEAHLFVQPKDGPTLEQGHIVSEGWVYIVLGDDPGDVISDYSINIEPLLAGANEIAEKEEDK
jgi:hypothetical protein